MADTPTPGTLVLDISRDLLGEFRGEWCGVWSLRPITGGREWTVAPENTQPATLAQQLRARTAMANARSRGELL
ncbi:hypothetical protein [Streptomyces alboflavus]|uniref:hypothetical protein n=1 Tax=Streptomyces alboflavus TaxID=67267 RepID=UPI000F6586C7|nr:hypothetical protein [Streptomyces alboflavus]